MKKSIVNCILVLCTLGLAVACFFSIYNEIAFDESEKSLFGDLFWKVLAWPLWIFLRERDK